MIRMDIERLQEYGVRGTVIDKLKELGFSKLTEVQKIAIEKGLFEGKNIVVSAPTNTGKTFIGELAILTAAKKT